VKEMVRIKVIPQAWIHNYAVEIDADGPTEFLVPIKDAQDKHGHWLKDRSYDSDVLIKHRNAPKWLRRHSGPFEVEILYPELEVRLEPQQDIST